MGTLTANTNKRNGIGVSGTSTGISGRGVVGSGGVGVQGNSSSDGSYGVAGYNSGGGYGVYGRGRFGVQGNSDSDIGYGVQGFNSSSEGVGVYGSSTGPLSYGVYGRSPNWAGYFRGDVRVTDWLNVNGNIHKGGGGFKIDHPLDPKNQYLNHSFVESPDMKNIYDGVVVLDTNGEAWIELDGWFEALNRDFRYQLTPIGEPGPALYIAQEIQNNRFKIAGGEAGMKVSWQVTGIRHDAYAEAHRLQVEENKSAEEKGTYLHPVEHGQAETLGIDYQRHQNLDQQKLPTLPSEIETDQL